MNYLIHNLASEWKLPCLHGTIVLMLFYSIILGANVLKAIIIKFGYREIFSQIKCFDNMTK